MLAAFTIIHTWNSGPCFPLFSHSFFRIPPRDNHDLMEEGKCKINRTEPMQCYLILILQKNFPCFVRSSWATDFHPKRPANTKRLPTTGLAEVSWKGLGSGNLPFCSWLKFYIVNENGVSQISTRYLYMHGGTFLFWREFGQWEGMNCLLTPTGFKFFLVKLGSRFYELVLVLFEINEGESPKSKDSRIY